MKFVWPFKGPAIGRTPQPLSTMAALERASLAAAARRDMIERTFDGILFGHVPDEERARLVEIIRRGLDDRRLELKPR